MVLPIISNDVGGVQDYTDPSFAVLLEQGDVDGFATEILNLANSHRAQHDRGFKARQFAKETLDWSHTAQAMMNVYTNLLSLQRA